MKLLNFKTAYIEMLKGKRIKRIGWKGWWEINSITGMLIIHLASGEEITMSENIKQTVENTLAEDWQIVGGGNDK